LLEDSSGCADDCGADFIAVDKKSCIAACPANTYERLFVK